MNTFNERLAKGKQVERYLGNYLEKLGYTIEYAPDGEFKDWDIRATKGGFPVTHEVKADFESSRTGNFFIEISYKGQPSGLASTQARYYTVIDKDGIHVFDAVQLKNWIELFCKRTVRGGDNGDTVGVLFPKSDFYKLHFYSFTSHNSI